MSKNFIILSTLMLAAVGAAIFFATQDDPPAKTADASSNGSSGTRPVARPGNSDRSSANPTRRGTPAGRRAASSAAPVAVQADITLPKAPAELSEDSSVADIIAFRLVEYHRNGGQLSREMIEHVPMDMPEFREAMYAGTDMPWNIPNAQGLTPVPPPSNINVADLPASMFISGPVLDDEEMTDGFPASGE